MTRPSASAHAEREAAFVLPLGSLAAAGPPLDLSHLRSPYYEEDEPRRGRGLWRMAQMLLATAVGLALLVVPMVVLSSVAREVYDVAISRSGTEAPGHAPKWDEPGSTLTPAGR